jgi:LacI family transcriptional regulator
VNLAQFARTIGLSASTVSRALNGYADVSAETRRRVEEAAAHVGYRASAAGRQLRTGRTEAIGFLLSPPRGASVNFFQLEMLAGIDEALRETPFHLVVYTAKSDQDEFDCLQRMVGQRMVEGVLLCRTRRSDERLIWLLREGFPFATVGRSQTAEAFAFVDIDHAASSRLACERLIGLGHRRIALLDCPASLMYSAHSRQGYEAAMRAAGLRCSRALAMHAEMNEAAGAAATRTLMAHRPRPTGLVCGDDALALGALRALAEDGFAAGRDVAVIGCGDNPLGSYASPPLTTFRANFRAAGQRATEMLLQRLGGAAADTLQEVWTPELVVRASDGGPPIPVDGAILPVSYPKSILAEDTNRPA